MRPATKAGLRKLTKATPASMKHALVFQFRMKVALEAQVAHSGLMHRA